ncbi:hypothetical protein ACPW96_08735 [Micromonospora sp. DT81.3]|uniref:hypothetical protein n=1 Tax=Micromonospora sp. DT81.3 TaxID=3416523 RepID=UPI003CEBDD47
MIRRIARFTATRFKAQYLLYGVLWTLTVEASAATIAPPPPDTDWRPTWQTAARVGIVLLVLLYLRIIDDQKDLTYDRTHHLDRPLVTGAVTARDLRAAMAVIAAVSVAGAVALAPWTALLLLATLAYGLVLWAIEVRSERIRTRVLANLVVTYPIQIVLTGWLLTSAVATGQVAPDPVVVWTLVIFAGTFLQFEFARKTARTGTPGEHLYSDALGVTGSTFVVGALATTAVAAYVALVQPWLLAPLAWLPAVPLVIVIVAIVRFLTSSKDRFPAALSALFVLTFYVAILVVALAM